MVWDGFLVLVLISLCMAGWNVGLINSWRGPIAMIVATFATQPFYIDFGTWIAQQTLSPPDWSAFIAYIFMWLAIEIVVEILLSLFLTWNRKENPSALNKSGGIAFALFRWAIICTLPLMAMQANPKIPPAPEGKDGLINPFTTGFKDSGLISFFSNVGKGLLPSLGTIIVSNKEPSFKPNFDKPKADLN